MCWESFDVVRFDLGALVQGQMRMPKVKSAYISLIIGPSSNMLQRGQISIFATFSGHLGF